MNEKNLLRIGIGISIVALLVATIGIVYLQSSIAELSKDASASKDALDAIISLNDWHDIGMLLEAKKEGTVVWYTSQATVRAQPLIDAFQKKYPFIKVEFWRSVGAKVYEKLTTELLAGQPTADVISSSDNSHFFALERDGYMMAYNSSQYANYPEEYRGDPPYWGVERAYLLTCAYNTNVYPDGPPFHNLSELANEKFRGKISLSDVELHPPGYELFVAYYLAYGQAFLDNYRNIIALDPAMSTSSSQMVEWVISGERPITMGISMAPVYDGIENGSPIAPIWLEEGAPLDLCGMGILNNTPHPNAAKLFLDWTLSEEAQRIQSSTQCFSLSMMTGIPVFPGGPQLEDMNLFVLSAQTKEDRRSEFLGIWESIVG